MTIDGVAVVGVTLSKSDSPPSRGPVLASSPSDTTLLRCTAAELGAHRLRELLELLLVDVADREQHEEQAHQQRQHVGVGDHPCLVVHVLFVLFVLFAAVAAALRR